MMKAPLLTYAHTWVAIRPLACSAVGVLCHPLFVRALVRSFVPSQVRPRRPRNHGEARLEVHVAGEAETRPSQ